MRVTVVYSPGARHVHEWQVVLAAGATVRDALLASGLGVAFSQVDLQCAPVGVWGKKVEPEHVLHDHDRVEVYRPLQVDPKTARRKRFSLQGTRAAGLFAKKKAGAKAGY